MRPCDIQMVRNATSVAGVRMTVDFSPVYFTIGSAAFAAVSAVSLPNFVDKNRS